MVEPVATSPHSKHSPGPGWVLAGGSCLAFLAAAVNAAFILHAGASVSHLTGDLSWVGIDLFDPQAGSRGAALQQLLAVVGGFVAGATCAGYFLHQRMLELDRPYGRTISGVGVLLVAAYAALHASWGGLALCLAGAGCGLQNAMATNYRGLILRTTHVTGLLTDLGAFLGMRWRGKQNVDAWKTIVPAVLVGAFFLGAFCGAALTYARGTDAVLVLGTTYILAGLGWTFWKHVVLRRLRARVGPHPQADGSLPH